MTRRDPRGALRALVPFAAVLGVVAPARANPADAMGLGSRAIALGGAVVADVEDPMASYYNPAGLVRTPALRLALAYQGVHSRFAINGVDSNVERVAGSTFGLTAPATFGGLRFAFGLLVHLPDQRLSRTRSAIGERPRWELWDTRPHKVLLSANLALRPVDWLLIGGGMTFQSATQLTLRIRGEASVIQPELRSRLEHGFEGDLTSIRYPQIGAQIIANDWLSFGAVYRAAFEVRNDLSAVVDGDVVLGSRFPLSFLLSSNSVSTYGPHQVSLGASVHPVPALTINAELTWVDWSRHPSLFPTEDIVLEIDIPPGLGIDIPDEIVGRRPVPLGLRDRVVPRIGLEAALPSPASMELRARAGYVFERTPFPEQTGVTNFVDADRHVLTVGAGIRLTDLEPTLPGFLAFDIHLMYGHLADRRHEKTSLVDPVGDYRTRGDQLGYGATMEIGFE